MEGTARNKETGKELKGSSFGQKGYLNYQLNTLTSQAMRRKTKYLLFSRTNIHLYPECTAEHNLCDVDGVCGYVGGWVFVLHVPHNVVKYYVHFSSKPTVSQQLGLYSVDLIRLEVGTVGYKSKLIRKMLRRMPVSLQKNILFA